MLAKIASPLLRAHDIERPIHRRHTTLERFSHDLFTSQIDQGVPPPTRHLLAKSTQTGQCDRVSWRLAGASSKCVVAVAVLIASGALTSCSPDSAGAVGLSLDSDGHLVGVVQVCQGTVDLAGVTRETNRQESGNRIGRWKSDSPKKGFFLLRFDEPPAEWEPLVNYEAPSSGTDYVFFVSNEDGDSEASITFNLSDLAGLPEGEVAYRTANGFARSSEDEFRRQACQH